MDIGKSVRVSLWGIIRFQIHDQSSKSLRASILVSAIELVYESTNRPLSERFGWQIGEVIKSTTNDNNFLTI